MASEKIQIDLKNLGAPSTVRRLKDMDGLFCDEKAYREKVKVSNPVVYEVYSMTPNPKNAVLQYGIGILMPGKIGNEYYFTKGHVHQNIETDEIYIGIDGIGCILLKNVNSGKEVLVQFGKDKIVYVPGYTAHRSINTGKIPLVYVGVYPARAGHNYSYLLEEGFGSIVVETDEGARLVSKETLESSV